MKNCSIKYLLINVVIFLSSCTEDIVHYLDQESLILFKKGDTVIFSNNQHVDSFNICTKNISIDQNDGYNDDYEVLRVDYCLLRSTETINYFSRYSNTLSFGWFALRNNWNYNEVDLSHYPEIEMVNYSIADTVFSDVYKLKRLPHDYTDSTVIVNVFYTHLFGVIAYECLNGEVYKIDVTRLPEKP